MAKFKPARAALAALGASCLVLGIVTGCGSDGDGSTTEASSAAVPSDAFPGQAASGEPVQIGLINNEGGASISQPENREAAEAATKYVNDNYKGIAGRPIELVVCKEAEEPVSARDCANQMVEKKVAAVIVTSSGFGNIMAPIITGAKIPYVTAVTGGATEGATDGAFVWSAGQNTSQALANYAKDQGMKSVVAYAIDVPASINALKMVGEPAFKAAGIDFKLVPIPLGTPDATPQVSAGLSSNPDGAIVFGESTVCTAVIKSLATLGSNAKIMSPQSCAAPEVVSGVGANALEGMKVVSSADTASDAPESALFRAIMAKYAPDTSTSGYAVTGYQGALGLYRAVAGLNGDVTATTITNAIRSAKNVVLPAGDGIKFTCDGTALAGQPSVCSNEMIMLTMKDGTLADPVTVSVLPQKGSE